MNCAKFLLTGSSTGVLLCLTALSTSCDQEEHTKRSLPEEKRVESRRRAEATTSGSRGDLRRDRSSWATQSLLKLNENKDYAAVLEELLLKEPAALRSDLATFEMLKNPSLEEVRKASVLFEALAAKDPKFIAERLSQPEGVNCQVWGLHKRLFTRMFIALGTEEFNATISPILTLSNTTKSRSQETISGLLQFIAESPNRDQFSSIAGQLFQGQLGMTHFSTYANAVALRDPAALDDLVADPSVPDTMKNLALRAGVFAKTQGDPAAAAELLKLVKRPDPLICGGIVASAMDTDPQLALKIVQGFTPDQLQLSLRDPMLLPKLDSKENAALIEKIFTSLPLTGSATESLSKLIGMLANYDQSKSVALVAELPASEQRKSLLATVMKKSVVSNYEEAQALLATLPDNLKGDAVGGLLNSFSVADNADLSRSLIDTAQPAQRSALASSQIATLSGSGNVDKAAEVFSQRLMDKTLSDADAQSGASILALRMANQGVEAARQWTQTLPNNLQAAATSGWFKVWLRNDPAAASQWATDLPGGEIKIVAAKQIVSATKDSDPETAASWDALIKSPKK